ncbi:uncharacterized protein LOC133785125 [Humulus lupulus]|uniref:uncharacterized protein LOC133785125 n=1 Tax=Humulus lupulus TaxID=3486 RepID=UPI002B402BCE|nr:uncharacterized protein LOC133785125 [Humulus lupulus]
MKSLAESLNAAGQLISDDELLLHILAGLGHGYHPMVVTITSSRDSISLQEVQFLLQIQEMRLDQLNSPTSDVFSPTANVATNQRHSFYAMGPNLSSGYGSPPFSSGRGCGSANRIVWQLCNRSSHNANKYYHIFEISFQGNSSSTAVNTTPQHVLPPPSTAGQQALFASLSALSYCAWFIDSGASHQIANNASSLTHNSENKATYSSL